MFIASVFLALHLISQYLLYFAGIDSSLFRLIVGALDLNNESTVSTWYSSATLLVCGMGFALVALAGYQAHSRLAHYWSALSLLAFLFSADEVAQLHEKLNGPVRMLVDMGSLFAIAWVLPGVAFLVFLLISFRRFFGSLPRSTRFSFALGTAVFFAGCLGVEMLGGEYSEAYGRDNFGYKVIAGFEEYLEMAGVAILLRAMLAHMNKHVSWKLRHQEPVVTMVHDAEPSQPAWIAAKHRLAK